MSLHQERFITKDSLGVVVTRADGSIKDTRYVKPYGDFYFEFVPNKLHLKLINSGRIQPNTWKIPVIFGSWTVHKDNN